MAAIPKSRWADTDSEEEGKEEELGERVITTLQSGEPDQHQVAKKKKKKKRVKSDSEEEPPTDPNIVTKILPQAPAAPPKTLREDGTAASKKEIKKKEIDELDSLLQELGVPSDAPESQPQSTPSEASSKPQVKAKSGKSSKKDIFGNVLAESSVRAEKHKKSKKKFPDYPRDS